MMAVDDWVAVVDKAIQMVGEDHVALGTDFDGGPTLARGMRDVRDLPMITDAMLRRGTQKSASISSGEATVAFLPARRSQRT
jgi:microsomal dipeptidase-like Zn-dependent dipeptidase